MSDYCNGSLYARDDQFAVKYKSLLQYHFTKGKFSTEEWWLRSTLAFTVISDYFNWCIVNVASDSQASCGKRNGKYKYLSRNIFIELVLGCGCNSVARYFPSMYKALDTISKIAREKYKENYSTHINKCTSKWWYSSIWLWRHFLLLSSIPDRPIRLGISK